MRWRRRSITCRCPTRLRRSRGNPGAASWGRTARPSGHPDRYHRVFRETFVHAAAPPALTRFNGAAETLLRNATLVAAVLVLVLLGGVIVALVEGSLPALRAFGIGFLFTESWNPVTEKFGAAGPIY